MTLNPYNPTPFFPNRARNNSAQEIPPGALAHITSFGGGSDTIATVTRATRMGLRSIALCPEGIAIGATGLIEPVGARPLKVYLETGDSLRRGDRLDLRGHTWFLTKTQTGLFVVRNPLEDGADSESGEVDAPEGGGYVEAMVSLDPSTGACQIVNTMMTGEGRTGPARVIHWGKAFELASPREGVVELHAQALENGEVYDTIYLQAPVQMVDYGGTFRLCMTLKVDVAHFTVSEVEGGIVRIQ